MEGEYHRICCLFQKNKGNCIIAVDKEKTYLAEQSNSEYDFGDSWNI